MHISTRTIVLSAMIAALYIVLTVFLAPIGYGPFQFRVACLLYGLVIFDPVFIIALAFGVFFANLASPFGPLDWAVMPFVTLAGCAIAYMLRRWPWMGLTILAAMISAGVAIFPLGMGAQLPFWLTFPGILATQIILIPVVYYVMWRPMTKTMEAVLCKI